MKTLSLTAAALAVLAAARPALPQQGKQGEPGEKKERAFIIHIAPPGAVWAPSGVLAPAIALKPVIRYVPSGTVLEGTATVSADQRYVTITTGAQQAKLIDTRSVDIDIVLAAADNALPGPGADAVAAPPPVLAGRYAEIAGELKLAGKQRAAIVGVLQARTMTESEWDLANGAELSRLELARSEAGDTPAGKLAARKIEAIGAARRMIGAHYHKQVMGLLAGPQRAKANGCLLARELRGEFASLALSAEQTTEIRKICDRAGRNYASTDDITADEAIRTACIQEAALRVLIAAQHRKYAGQKAPPSASP